MLLSVLLGLLPSFNAGFYDPARDSVTQIGYDAVYLRLGNGTTKSFLEGCTAGTCTALNMDGTPTGLTGIPEKADVFLSSRIKDLYMVQIGGGFGGGTQKYFWADGSELILPDGYSLKESGALGGSKLCHFPIGMKNPITTCFDVKTKQIIKYPFAGMSFAGGYAIDLGSEKWGKFPAKTGSIFSDGKKRISANHCDDKALDNGDFVFRCCRPEDGFRCEDVQKLVIGSDLVPIHSEFGSLENRYGVYSTWLKKDRFGAESLTVTRGNERVASYIKSGIIYSDNMNVVCGGGEFYSNKDGATCTDFETKAKFKVNRYCSGCTVTKVGLDTIVWNRNNNGIGSIQTVWGPNAKFLESQDNFLYADGKYFQAKRIGSTKRFQLLKLEKSLSDSGLKSTPITEFEATPYNDNPIGLIGGKLYFGMQRQSQLF